MHKLSLLQDCGLITTPKLVLSQLNVLISIVTIFRGAYYSREFYGSKSIGLENKTSFEEQYLIILSFNRSVLDQSNISQSLCTDPVKLQ